MKGESGFVLCNVLNSPLFPVLKTYFFSNTWENSLLKMLLYIKVSWVYVFINVWYILPMESLWEWTFHHHCLQSIYLPGDMILKYKYTCLCIFDSIDGWIFAYLKAFCTNNCFVVTLLLKSTIKMCYGSAFFSFSAIWWKLYTHHYIFSIVNFPSFDGDVPLAFLIFFYFATFSLCQCPWSRFEFQWSEFIYNWQIIKSV